MQALLVGVYPTKDPWGAKLTGARGAMAGQLLLGGRTMAVVEYRGDWAWHVSMWAMGTNWASAQVCWICKASKQNCCDFSDAAGWRGSDRTRAEFVDEVVRPGDRIHVTAMSIPGFHPDMIAVCSLHTVNLGWAQQIHGSIFVALMEEGFFSDVQTAYQSFQQWKSRNAVNCSVIEFTKGNTGLCAKSYPVFTMKGYNSRVLSAWLSEVSANAVQAAAAGTELHHERRLRGQCIFLLNDWYLQVEQASRFLSAEDAIEQATTMEKCLRAYARLAARAIAARKRRYQLLPKVHLAIHLASRTRSLRYNVKMQHTFKDEDFMGKLKRPRLG
jgi:hypothetical protein